MPPLRLPKRLAGPATIGIFAPSGVVDAQAHARSVSHLEALGHRVIAAPETTSQWRYFAGTDRERLAVFHRMLADPAIDILLAARGGYGWTRLLPDVDFGLVAATDKIIVGFSDFTAFSLAALAKAKLVTFAGPMAAVDFGSGDVSTFMESHFWPLLASGGHTIEVAADTGYAAQVIQGPIWGSNLSLLAHLVGTPYLPAIDGGILFLEEIAEEPYAVERLFFQLYHAGILTRQKALILADFDSCQPTDNGRYPYRMAEVIETLRKLLPIPVLTGLPFGHVREKITLPIGGHATLNIVDKSYRLEVSAYNLE
ncbi:MAG: LD-carboxypeptidase [Burkholderiales bacterium]|nr:LD-carboxypeptidase [Burkholderiales bacterium]